MFLIAPGIFFQSSRGADYPLSRTFFNAESFVSITQSTDVHTDNV
jgi:hypothetical protein